MSIAPYMNLISEVLPVQRRDFYMADATLLNPNNANPVLDGEWLQLDSTYKLTRGASGNVAVPSWQLFAERGRFDTQSIRCAVRRVMPFSGFSIAQVCASRMRPADSSSEPSQRVRRSRPRTREPAQAMR